MQPQAWTKVLPPHFLQAREAALLRAQDYEAQYGVPTPRFGQEPYYEEDAEPYIRSTQHQYMDPPPQHQNPNANSHNCDGATHMGVFQRTLVEEEGGAFIDDTVPMDEAIAAHTARSLAQQNYVGSSHMPARLDPPEDQPPRLSKGANGSYGCASVSSASQRSYQEDSYVSHPSSYREDISPDPNMSAMEGGRVNYDDVEDPTMHEQNSPNSLNEPYDDPTLGDNSFHSPDHHQHHHDTVQSQHQALNDPNQEYLDEQQADTYDYHNDYHEQQEDEIQQQQYHQLEDEYNRNSRSSIPTGNYVQHQYQDNQNLQPDDEFDEVERFASEPSDEYYDDHDNYNNRSRLSHDEQYYNRESVAMQQEMISPNSEAEFSIPTVSQSGMISRTQFSHYTSDSLDISPDSTPHNMDSSSARFPEGSAHIHRASNTPLDADPSITPSSATRGAQELLRRNRQRRLEMTPQVRQSQQRLSPPTIPLTDSKASFSVESSLDEVQVDDPTISGVSPREPSTYEESGSGSEVTGESSVWSDAAPDRNSRRALILQMAKARMKNNPQPTSSEQTHTEEKKVDNRDVLSVDGIDVTSSDGMELAGDLD